MPWTYDGHKVVAVPFAEELPKVYVVSLRLRRLVTRPSVAVFTDFARRHFAETWPKLTQAPPGRRAARRK